MTIHIKTRHLADYSIIYFVAVILDQVSYHLTAQILSIWKRNDFISSVSTIL